MRLDGKIVLLTGASRGIGAACAREFAAAGAELSLTARSAETLSRAAPAGALLTAGDLTLPETRRRVVERTLDRFGSIDVLVNNAGAGLYGPSWDASLDHARGLMELNFFALLAMIQLVTPHMRSRRAGAIVNIGSIAGQIPLPWATLYSASKSAVASLTAGLRMELRADGIRVMLVSPAYVATEFQEHALSGRAPARVRLARRSAVTAAECARAIRRGLERDARTVFAPSYARLLAVLAGLCPWPIESRLAQWNAS